MLVILCAAVVLLQSFTVWKSRPSQDKPSPTQEDVESGKWELPPRVKKAETSFERYRLRIRLPWESHRIAPGATERVAFERGDKNGRIAKFRLTDGTAVRIAYENPRGKVDSLCLCGENGLAHVNPLPDCGKGFSVERCATEGELVLYGKEGHFTLEGHGLSGGTVKPY